MAGSTMPAFYVAHSPPWHSRPVRVEQRSLLPVSLPVRFPSFESIWPQRSVGGASEPSRRRPALNYSDFRAASRR